MAHAASTQLLSSSEYRDMGVPGYGFMVEPADPNTSVSVWPVIVRLDNDPGREYAVFDRGARLFAEPFRVLNLKASTNNTDWRLTVFTTPQDWVGGGDTASLIAGRNWVGNRIPVAVSGHGGLLIAGNTIDQDTVTLGTTEAGALYTCPGEATQLLVKPSWAPADMAAGIRYIIPASGTTTNDGTDPALIIDAARYRTLMVDAVLTTIVGGVAPKLAFGCDLVQWPDSMQLVRRIGTSISIDTAAGGLVQVGHGLTSIATTTLATDPLRPWAVRIWYQWTGGPTGANGALRVTGLH